MNKLASKDRNNKIDVDVTCIRKIANQLAQPIR
jgi:hypothetical protein